MDIFFKTKILLKLKANVNSKHLPRDILHKACMERQTDLVKLLLRRKADPNQKCSHKGCPPLAYEYTVKYDKSIDWINEHKFEDIKCLLLHYKATPDPYFPETRKPIAIASSYRCDSSTLQFLIAQKADVTPCALHFAVNDLTHNESMQLKKINMLLKANANPLINTLKLAYNTQLSTINHMIGADAPRHKINSIIRNIQGWRPRISSKRIGNVLKSLDYSCLNKIYHENCIILGGASLTNAQLVECIASRLTMTCMIHHTLYQRYVHFSLHLMWCIQNIPFWKSYPGFIPFLVSNLLVYTNNKIFRRVPSFLEKGSKGLFLLIR